MLQASIWHQRPTLFIFLLRWFCTAAFLFPSLSYDTYSPAQRTLLHTCFFLVFFFFYSFLIFLSGNSLSWSSCLWYSFSLHASFAFFSTQCIYLISPTLAKGNTLFNWLIACNIGIFLRCSSCNTNKLLMRYHGKLSVDMLLSDGKEHNYVILLLLFFKDPWPWTHGPNGNEVIPQWSCCLQCFWNMYQFQAYL